MLVIFLAIYPYVNVKNIQNVIFFKIFRRNNFFWFSKRIFHGKWHIMEKISSEMDTTPRYKLLVYVHCLQCLHWRWYTFFKPVHREVFCCEFPHFLVFFFKMWWCSKIDKYPVSRSSINSHIQPPAYHASMGKGHRLDSS